MIRPQYLLPEFNDELIFDNFAGGGGYSVGVEMALGRHVDHAINHDAKALGMHRINHPQTIHHCEDIFDVNPGAIAAGGPGGSPKRIGYAHFSPDCKHFSKAKGGRPLNKKIRGLVLVMFRYAALGTRVMTMENVEEITTWCPLLPNGQPDLRHKGRTWKAFLAALGRGLHPDHPDLDLMLKLVNRKPKKNRHLQGPPPPLITKEQLVRGFGYQFEWRLLRGCDFGAPTIRKRLFLICRNDGRPIVWPEPTHFAPKDLPAARKRLGRAAKPHRIIADCLDWSLPCPSIFLTRAQARQARCKRPLANPTLQRVAFGIDRYVLRAGEPFFVNLTHQGGERIEPVSAPGKTITGARRGEKALVNPQLAPFLTEHANATHQRNFPADEPLRTQVAQVKGGHFSLVSPTLVHVAHGERDRKGKKRGRGAKAVTEQFPSVLASNDGAVVAAHLTKFNTGAVGQPLDKPVTAITAGSHAPDTHGGAASVHGVVAATMVQTGYGEREGQNPRVPHLDKPLGTAVSSGKHAVVAGSMVKLRGDVNTHAPGHPLDEPGHTSSAGGTHHALSTVYLAQHNAGFNTNPGHPVTKPVSPITTKGSQQQLVSATMTLYYGSEAEGQALDESLRTVSTKPRFGLAVLELAAQYPNLTPEQIKGALRVANFLRRFGVVFEGDFAIVTAKDGSQWVIVDIGMRMLTPRELFRAQGFHNGYIIDEAWLISPRTGKLKVVKLTKEEQIRMCGNSVCPDVAEAITAANVPELALWKPGEQKRRKQELALVA